MRNWIEDMTEQELETVRATLIVSIDSKDIGVSTRQNAKMILNEIEDYFWNNVCRNMPVDSDQLDIELQ
jgi:hypothetical protein